MTIYETSDGQPTVMIETIVKSSINTELAHRFWSLLDGESIERLQKVINTHVDEVIASYPSIHAFQFLQYHISRNGYKIKEDREKLLKCCTKHSIEIYNYLRSETSHEYVSLSQDKDGMISYARRPEDKYNNKKRVKCKLIRFLMRTMSTNELAQFGESYLKDKCSDIIADMFPELGILKILKGRDIVKAYKSINISGNCMSGCDSDKVQIYADNPSIVSLLVFAPSKESIRYSCRALLWHCEDEKGNKLKAMDRVYPNDGEHVAIFRKYAKDNGYLQREDYSLPEGNSSTHEIPLSISMDRPTNNLFPYMDSFRFSEDAPDSSKFLFSTSRNYRGMSCSYLLDSTSGSYATSNNCQECGDYYHPDDGYGDCFCSEICYQDSNPDEDY